MGQTGDKRISTKMLAILQDGRHYSSIELTKLCNCSQPSGIIRNLRKDYNYNVQFEWCVNNRGTYYKKFWLDPQNLFIEPEKVQNDPQLKINFNFE